MAARKTAEQKAVDEAQAQAKAAEDARVKAEKEAADKAAAEAKAADDKAAAERAAADAAAAAQAEADRAAEAARQAEGPEPEIGTPEWRRRDHLRALEEERDGLKRVGKDDRVKDVEAEIKRVKSAPIGRKAPQGRA